MMLASLYMQFVVHPLCSLFKLLDSNSFFVQMLHILALEVCPLNNMIIPQVLLLFMMTSTYVCCMLYFQCIFSTLILYSRYLLQKIICFQKCNPFLGLDPCRCWHRNLWCIFFVAVLNFHCYFFVQMLPIPPPKSNLNVSWVLLLYFLFKTWHSFSFCIADTYTCPGRSSILHQYICFLFFAPDNNDYLCASKFCGTFL